MRTQIALYRGYSSNNLEEYSYLEGEEFELVQIDSSIKIVVLDEKNFRLQLKRVANLNLQISRGSNFILGVVVNVTNGKLRRMISTILENYPYISDVIPHKEFDITYLRKYREIMRAVDELKVKKVVLYNLVSFQTPMSLKCSSVCRLSNLTEFTRLVEVSEDLVAYIDPYEIEEEELLVISSYLDKDKVRFTEKPEKRLEVYGSYDPILTM